MSEEMFESRAIAQLVEQQWKKWLLLTQQRAAKEALGPFPTVALSRERGSGGGIIGKQVADRLGFILFDSEIVDHVARAAAVERMVVAHMDERSQRSIKEWTDRIVKGKRFSAQGYMAHLVKAILAAGEKANAIIIGRGAHLLLPVERCLRVRVIAPLDTRIERLCSTGLKRAEAESIIAETDRQRAQFIQENFQESDANPLLYDLVINTGEIALETATELIVRAVEAKFPQVLQARQSAVPVPERLAAAERTP